MKKIVSLLALMLTAVRICANPIDAEKARQIALDFLPASESMTLVGKATRNQAKSLKLSQSVSATSPYYIYSRGEGQGFVIVSGDDCMPAILGYTDSGDFDASDLPPALQDMLESWAQTVEDAQVAGTNTKKPSLTATTRSNIAPIMTSHWHQSSPYNDRCPYLTGTTNRAATGCVATAASQILYYWRKDLPSTLQATTPTYGYGDAPVTESVPAGTTLHWDLMQDSYSGGESSTVKDAVAEFVFATGAATWLTYGSSTSGNIEKIPYTFSTYFGMNGGTVHYRNSYSQENWVQLLYDELAKGRPVMYTGVHPSNGGHAVVVHGYQKSSDLFYFNFGWGAGNGYDGYYTVNTETGMNGFNESQSALIGAYPKNWNISVDMEAPEVVYAQRTNEFKVTIENNSTLPQQGFYLFASTSSSKPSSLSSAKSSDTETVVESGRTATIVLTCKPTSVRKWYITVTTPDLSVLKQIEVTPDLPSSSLQLNFITSEASADTEVHDDITYSKFYSNKAAFKVNITNEDEMDYEGTGKINIYVFNEDTQEWDLNGSNSNTSVNIPAFSTSDVLFSVANTTSCPLQSGKLYYAEVANPWKTSVTTDSIDLSRAQSTRTYFVLAGSSDLAVVSYEDSVLTVSGHWDKASFETLAKRNTYADAVAYDLTQVEYFSDNFDSSVLPNPNAVIYVSGSDVYYTAKNIVNEDGICGNLSLTVGYSFRPKAAFSAQFASVTFGSEVGKWYLVTMPFTGVLSDGIYARRIDTHKTSGLTSSCTTDVTVLEAGYTYLVMTSATFHNKILAPNSDALVLTSVVTEVKENADPSVVGTLTGTTIPAGAQIINNDETQYFVPVTVETHVPGLSGYFYASNMTRKFRVNTTSSIDPAYIQLAESINTAYGILEEYMSSASDGAYEAYLECIHAAELEFSYRENTELTSATLIKQYAANLLELGESYKDGSIVNAISQAPSSAAPAIVGIYNLSGIRLTGMQKGINIVLMSDGTSKKIIVR